MKDSTQEEDFDPLDTDLSYDYTNNNTNANNNNTNTITIDQDQPVDEFVNYDTSKYYDSDEESFKSALCDFGTSTVDGSLEESFLAYSTSYHATHLHDKHDHDDDEWKYTEELEENEYELDSNTNASTSSSATMVDVPPTSTPPKRGGGKSDSSDSNDTNNDTSPDNINEGGHEEDETAAMTKQEKKTTAFNTKNNDKDDDIITTSTNVKPVKGSKSDDHNSDPSSTVPNNTSLDSMSTSSERSEWIRIHHNSTTNNTNNKHRNNNNMKKKKKKREKVNSITFNQDRSCIALGTDSGYTIRTLPQQQSQNHNMVRVHRLNLPSSDGITQIQILHSTSLLAIVYKSSPRIVTLTHARTARKVKELPFTSAVRRIEMNRMTMVVMTADATLHLFAFCKDGGGLVFLDRMGILYGVSESARMFTAKPASTPGAFFDLCNHVVATAATPREEDEGVVGDCDGDGDGDGDGRVRSSSMSWLVTKSADGVGMVSVYSISYRRTQIRTRTQQRPCVELVNKFEAHHHGITRIVIGGGGGDNGDDMESRRQKETYFATASLQGTVIRVFRLPSCEKLYDLQRGSSPCTIFSMSFNYDATRLAVSSSKGTVHIFDVEEKTKQSSDGAIIENDGEGRGGNDGVSAVDASNFRSDGLVSSTSARWNDAMSRLARKIGLKTKVENVDGIGEKKDALAKDTDKKTLRSYARVRKVRRRRRRNRSGANGDNSDDDGPTTNPNSIALLKTAEEGEEQLVVCSESGKLFQFAVSRDGKSRPVQAEDMLFPDCNSIEGA